jgi:hypothetical protein
VKTQAVWSEATEAMYTRARAVHARRARCIRSLYAATTNENSSGLERSDRSDVNKGSRRPRASSPLQQEHAGVATMNTL